MKPLVSILIPAFNSQTWIAETLRSALSQDWPRKEIIVVDDGSTDRTVEIAKQLESNILKVVTQDNQGAAAARNTAYSLSQGDYIQWLDADDLIAPEKITRQINALDGCASPRTLVSGSWGRFLYRHYRAKFTPTALWCDLSRVEWLIRKMGQNLYMQTASWLVSRELSEAAGPWDTQLLTDDDGEYFCRVVLCSDGIRFVPESRIYYRASGAGLSYIGDSDIKRDAQWRSIQLHIAYLRSLEDSPRVHTACMQFVQDAMIFFYPERLDIFHQAEDLCRELGGQLRPPDLPWKYSWIKAVFGWRLARRAQRILPKVRWSLARSWDKTLARIENPALVGSFAI